MYTIQGRTTNEKSTGLSLRGYLLESYLQRQNTQSNKKKNQDIAFIQIDDQDDRDSIADFCNIFVTFTNHVSFLLELTGSIPVTGEMITFIEMYQGRIDEECNTIRIPFSYNEADAIEEFAEIIQKTAMLGPIINNHHWHKISARTIYSLHCFARILKEYQIISETALP